VKRLVSLLGEEYPGVLGHEGGGRWGGGCSSDTRLRGEGVMGEGGLKGYLCWRDWLILCGLIMAGH